MPYSIVAAGPYTANNPKPGHLENLMIWQINMRCMLHRSVTVHTGLSTRLEVAAAMAVFHLMEGFPRLELSLCLKQDKYDQLYTDYNTDTDLTIAEEYLALMWAREIDIVKEPRRKYLQLLASADVLLYASAPGLSYGITNRLPTRIPGKGELETVNLLFH